MGPPDGRESVAAGDVARAVAAMRGAVPGVPIGVSTGAWIVVDSERRLKEVERWTVLPDYASVNFHEDGSRQLAELLHSRGVGIEAGLSNARGGEVLRESGLAQHCLRVLLEPPDQDADAALGVVTQLEAMLDGAGITIPRLLHGVGRAAWHIIDEAATRGYHTRVGFEDILTLPDGATAPSNAALVVEARRRMCA